MSGPIPYFGLLVASGKKYRMLAVDPRNVSLQRRLRNGIRRRAASVVRRRKQHLLREQMGALGPAPNAAHASGPVVQSLTGSGQLEMAIASAKSLMLSAGRPLQYLFHDDGTLTEADSARLRAHLPGCRVISRAQADARAERALARYPALRRCRSTNLMMLKLIDVALWAPANRILYVDSDILFFAEPSRLLAAATSGEATNLLLRDVGTVYAVSSATVRQQLAVELFDCINAGLFVINRGDIDLLALERWLSSPPFDAHVDLPILDQQLTALCACASPDGAQFLPPTYDMLFELPVEDLVCRHYAGSFRHGFVLEGVGHLLSDLQFESRWQRFALTGRARAVPPRTVRHKPRLLLTAYVAPPGGGSMVGAWAVEALRDDYDLTVLTWSRLDLEEVNRAFGTTLHPADAEWVTVPRLIAHALKLAPVPLSLLMLSCNMRYARRLLRRREFDGVLGTMNELDVGTRAFQYIHYPWAKFPRPDVDYRWYHWGPAVRLYRHSCNWIGGYREQRATANLTYANSEWTAALFREWYGRPCRVLYPPVVGGFPELPVDERRHAFAVIGRFSPEKELEKVMEIVAAVRARGHDVELTIIGTSDDAAYRDHIRRTAADHGSWIRLHENLDRNDLVELVARHRFGIHGMRGEHFGIAPAELQLAGCVTFVADGGGPTEIVGHDERLIYSDRADAVAKISAVLDDPDLDSALRRSTRERARQFTVERFSKELREAVCELLEARQPKPADHLLAAKGGRSVSIGVEN